MGAAEAEAWREAHDRVVELARRHDLSIVVPATPAWTAKDLVGHMAAVGIEHVAGTAADGHPEEWTQQGVDARKDRPLDDVLAEWTRAVPDIVDLVAGPEPGLIVDLAVHEQDLRGALGEPGARTGVAADAVFDFYVGDRLVDNAKDLPSLTIEAGERTLDVGTGESAGTLEVDGYELVRAACGRRSEAQVRSWSWPVDDPTPWVEAVSAYGELHDVDLVE